MPLKLGVNIDHVATLRQVRFATMLESPNAEPVLLDLAKEAVNGGADYLTIHLRADRRHIQDHDVTVICESNLVPVNFEMGNTEEILEIAIAHKPAFVCLVPEIREEITTEGGLDVVSQRGPLKETIKRLQGVGIQVSLFIDPDSPQLEVTKELGAEMVELHTGAFANAIDRGNELQRLIDGATLGHQLGLQINAGHGINSSNISDLYQVPYLAEFNIGHHLVSRALTVGLHHAVAEMRELMDAYPG
jgi:pyridoxine 5-phosphate synthase